MPNAFSKQSEYKNHPNTYECCGVWGNCSWEINLGNLKGPKMLVGSPPFPLSEKRDEIDVYVNV